MRRAVKIILTNILLLIFVTGCWDSQELDQRALVGGIGVDTQDDIFKVTCQIIPSEAAKAVLGGSTGGDPNLIWDITTKGETIIDTMYETKTITGRDPSFSHTRVLMFSEELAKKGIRDAIDFFKRNEEIRRRVWIVIAEDEIEEIFKTENKLNLIPSYGISEVMEAANIYTDVAAIDLHLFSTKASCDSSAAYAPIVFLREISYIKSEKSSNEEESNSSERITSDKQIDVHKTAIFNDYKMVGLFDQKETRGLMWVNDLLNVTAVDVKSPQNLNKLINLSVNSISTTVKPVLEDGRITMKIETKAHSHINEKHDHELNTSKPQALEDIALELNKVIEEEVTLAIKKAQSLRADVFDFGDIIDKDYPKYWESIKDNWPEEFQKIQFDIEFNTDVTWSGRVDNSG